MIFASGHFKTARGVKIYLESVFVGCCAYAFAGVELYWANIKAGALLTWPAQPTPAVLGYRSGVRALIVNSSLASSAECQWASCQRCDRVFRFSCNL